MKRITSQISIVVGLLLAMAISGFAAPLGPTVSTLSAAVASSRSNTTITVGSTTGMAVSTQPGVTAYVLLDGELTRLLTVVSSTQLTVSRGQGSTNPTTHASGAYAVYGLVYGTSWDATASGSPTYGNFLARGAKPTGGCSLASQQYSPVFGVVDLAGNPDVAAYACVGGVWQRGNWPAVVDVPAIRQCTIPLSPSASDLTAYGTDAVRTAGSIFVSSLDVPGPNARVVTLLSNLTGTTAPTTDKQLFALYDSAPGTTAAAVIASSAIAGHAAATADIFYDQNIALVGGAANTTLILVPGRYFFAFQDDTGTTTIQMIATAGGYNAVVGNARTGVFGTLANITLPTTLTTSAAPIACIG